MPAVQEREYVLYCDESVDTGKYYSNFYGGALIAASQLESVKKRLHELKQREHLFGEVKWQKVTAPYLDKYKSLMNSFFDQVESGAVRIRIMFRQNAKKPIGLSPIQVEEAYYRLYYQFIKHAFGFANMPRHANDVSLRVYLDQFPDTGEQVARFRGFILGLNASRPFKNAKLGIRKSDLTEVRSHEHVILQCLDIVLGAMAFRLNDMHKQKPPGSRRRGSRTIAKDALYKHIRSRIVAIRPNFNIGVTTGGTPDERWSQPYRHWSFLPSQHEHDALRTKPRK